MEPSTPGAISLSSSSHFALKPYSNIIKPVALPPGWARLSTKPAPTGSGTITNTIGTVRVASNTAAAPALPLATMTSNASAANSVAALLVSAASPAPQRASICRLRPSIQPSSRSRCKKKRPNVPGLRHRYRAQEPDGGQLGGLLRAPRERPRCRTAEQRDELAPLHSITSSASNWIELGTSMPSALAVCRLMTNSNLVDRTTGSSAGFAPLRIRPV